MGTTKKYWKGLDELNATPAFVERAEKEFAQELTVDQFLADDTLKESSTGRRDFLKFLGFSVAAATLAACEAPVVKAVPYVVKPEDVTPGVANWYASSYYDGYSYASVLVKTREGRPIHIKGNRDHGFTNGAINPQIAASVLSLYDGERLKGPQMTGALADWNGVDSEVIKGLNAAQSKGKKIVLLSSTVISPTGQDIIGQFMAKFGGAAPVMGVAPAEGNAAPAEGTEAIVAGDVASNDKVEHIQYDAVSYNGIREANLESFGKRIIPDYDFSKAKVIVSVGADFLNSWLLPTQFMGQYQVGRNPDAEQMSKHFQFEANMSITGSNADVRGMVKPSEYGKVLAFLHKEVSGTGVNGVDTASLSEDVQAKLKMAAELLKKNKGTSLVVCGSNRKSHQVVVNSINNALSNYALTIDLNNPINLFVSEDDKMTRLLKEMNEKKIGALIMWDTNPAYSHASGDAFKAALANVDLTVSMARYADETATACQYICPDHHALESWYDFNPKMNHYSLAQPTIRPLNDTRSAMESLMVWAGMANHVGPDSTNFHDKIKSTWQQYGFPTQTKHLDFFSYWNECVHNSCSSMAVTPQPTPAFAGNLANAGKDIASVAGGEWEISLYQKASLGIGTQSGNPWLQEMPDPISKVSWDNYVTMSLGDMKALGLSTEVGQESPSGMVSVKVGEKELLLPVYPQPGQTPKTIGIALGYGRGEGGEKIGRSSFHTDFFGKHESGSNGGRKSIGANAFKIAANGILEINADSITKTGENYYLACSQTHSTVMARNSIVKETTLDIYKNQPKEAYNHVHMLHSGWNHDENHISEYNLWDEHPVENVGHRWAMTIDLSSCIGCGSCLIACQSENNVPVVGKDEIRRGRDMHWLRLDRYYASDVEPAVGTRDEAKFDAGGFAALEVPSENPKVVHMPMMCHHCNHAPCETVCPVAATTHSNEGLNQMSYNRCIGTRYCANNCPYKVRRFNWFNYPSYRKFVEVNPAQDDLGRMVLNPDVVVRTRGVMEKCSFCVQKIQAGKLVAKKEDRKLVDGDVTTACSDVCPTNAITVGDWNDVESLVRKSSQEDRAYQALEEVGTKPNIWYKVKVRNDDNDALEAIQTAHDSGHGEEHAEEAHGEESNTEAHH
ncbi:MAG: TAT-variant-translocated molybdopterin oxidoreductase [Crocinitomicaceae bacterium]|nr:TAT-variant-translocated molybdopterin oxidoreductase [Crocinitomicaceae bacterium]